jgi:hypothetical protein
MGDSLLNFSDIGSPEYTGMYDTSSGFSGSSTLQDVQLGSPVLLDTSFGPSDTAIPDLINQPSFGPQPLIGGETISNVPPNPDYAFSSQSLAGTSDVPLGSSIASTPTPNVSPGNSQSMLGLTMLSKFGASIASLWSNPAPVHAGAQQRTTTPAGAYLPPGGVSGTNTLLLVIVVGALVLLLLRSE